MTTFYAVCPTILVECGLSLPFFAFLRALSSVWRDAVDAKASLSFVFVWESCMVRALIVAVRFAMVFLSATVAFARLFNAQKGSPCMALLPVYPEVLAVAVASFSS